MQVFLDESGNSGKNFLDHAQPFYVLGGWIIEKKNRNQAQEAIRTWERLIQGKVPGRGEVKSSRVLRRRDGLTRLNELFSDLGRVGCIPTHCIFEKRFGSCAQIVDAFLDPRYNTLITEDFITDADRKWGYANDLYSAISGATIRDFHMAAESNDPAQVARFKTSLILRLTGSDADYLADFIARANDREAARYIFSGDNAVKAINTTIFLSQLMLIERFFRECGGKTGQIIHDRIPQLEDMFGRITDGIRNAPERQFQFNNDMQLYLGAKQVTGVEFADSKEEPLIRAADHYVGCINYLLKNLNKLKVSQRPGHSEVTQSTLSPVLAMLAPSGGIPRLYFHTFSGNIANKVLQACASTFA